MRSDHLLGLSLLAAIALTVGYNLWPSPPPPPPASETAGSKCISRVSSQRAAAILARLDYETKHPELLGSPEVLLAERHEKEAYCSQEASCFLLDEADASRRKALYDAAFSSCLDDEGTPN